MDVRGVQHEADPDDGLQQQSKVGREVGSGRVPNRQNRQNRGFPRKDIRARGGAPPTNEEWRQTRCSRRVSLRPQQISSPPSSVSLVAVVNRCLLRSALLCCLPVKSFTRRGRAACEGQTSDKRVRPERRAGSKVGSSGIDSGRNRVDTLAVGSMIAPRWNSLQTSNLLEEIHRSALANGMRKSRGETRIVN